MISIIRLTLILLLVQSTNSIMAQKQEEVCYNPNLVKDTTKKSIKSMAFAIMGDDSMKIVYHSPGVRNRVIWGGLVPYDEVWVTGAHDATTIEFKEAIVIDGKTIQPGKYAVFTIPGKKTWTFILNSNWQQHLASEYEQSEDIIRLQVKPKKNNHTERLQYFIEITEAKKGQLSMAWEKKLIQVPFTRL